HQMKSLKENWIKSIKQLNQKCSIYYCNLRKENFDISNKLELLKSIRALISKYIVAVKRSLDLYSKACANKNDRKKEYENRITPGTHIGPITLKEYYSQRAKAEDIYDELTNDLLFYGNNAGLLADVNDIWNIFDDNLYVIRSVATNQNISKEEKDIDDDLQKKEPETKR
ncbi:hypothetical protein, partial [Lactobacillus helveticus]